jgi:mono/diheme cytochrome c family protein
MLKKLLLTGTAAAIALGIFTIGSCAPSVAQTAAQAKANNVTIPVAKTAANNGKQMYGSYCASCHGVSGKGDGPVGIALRTRPSDLTVLAKNNGGKYPSVHVVSVIKLGVSVPLHGTSEMPVWGPVLGKMDHENTLNTPLRISNLSRYIESMQAK